MINPLDKQYKKRFSIRLGQHIKLLETEQIECFYSEHKATYAYTSDKKNYLLDLSLETLEEQLDPDEFFRVSRKFLIRRQAIADIISYTNSRLQIRLRHFNEMEIIVSREKVRGFKDWLE